MREVTQSHKLADVCYDIRGPVLEEAKRLEDCLLYTSDAADERSSVDLGGRRIIKKKNNMEVVWHHTVATGQTSRRHES
mgnify:CR=1 FL=1